MFRSLATSFTKSSVRAFSTDVRPFKVLGLQQVALGHLSKGTLSNFWVDIMGVPKVHTFKSEKENVDEDILSLGTVSDRYLIHMSTRFSTIISFYLI